MTNEERYPRTALLIRELRVIGITRRADVVEVLGVIAGSMETGDLLPVARILTEKTGFIPDLSQETP